MSDGAVFSARMVRELKGAPLSCLMLLLIAGQPVKNKWLAMMSGYTDKPISQALDLLSSPEYQLARRSRGGWMIAQGLQLVLSDEESRKFSDFAMNRKNSVPTTTTGSMDLINLNIDQVVVGSRKNSDFAIIGQSEEEKDYQANLEACRRNKIFEPSASDISNMEHVTPELIDGHVQGLGVGDRVGLAILRIKNNEPLPETQEKVLRTRHYGSSQFDQYFRPDDDEPEEA